MMKKRQVLGAIIVMCLMNTSLSMAAKELSDDIDSVEESTRHSQFLTKQIEQEARNELKYIFLFIGDGMSFPQIQMASDYLGTIETGKIVSQELSFMNFPVLGTAQTYDSSSFVPDSSSTATALATGQKTYSGALGVDVSGTVVLETIAEKLKRQNDYKIGIVTTVNINHATPGAFYAHQPSRSNYYEIALEAAQSGFDFFAGESLLEAEGGVDSPQLSAYTNVENAGYQLITTLEDLEGLNETNGKYMVVGDLFSQVENLAYAIDATENQWQLKDYVELGINVLDNENGFFMMAEGGKIDWACHANDAATMVGEVVAFSEAVEVAINFYEKHPKETLILVTGDHETGGLSIGYAGTDYSTYLENLTYQSISYSNFNSYVSEYKKNQTGFEIVLEDIRCLFGLVSNEYAQRFQNDSERMEYINPKLILTEYEYGILEEAYKRTLAEPVKEKQAMSQEEYLLYGTYEPLVVTLTHILNNKSGLNFSSYAHTGLPAPVFALGNGQELFSGYYDNTDVFHKLVELTGVK